MLHNSTLTPRQVEAAVYPHLGPDKTLQDVQAARADLEKAYHDAGYSTVFVDIPARWDFPERAFLLHPSSFKLAHLPDTLVHQIVQRSDEFFIDRSSSQREQLRRAIPGEAVHYVIANLRTETASTFCSAWYDPLVLLPLFS